MKREEKIRVGEKDKEREREREREEEREREKERERAKDPERGRQKRSGEEVEVVATVVRGSRNRAGGGPALTDYRLASRRQAVWWGGPQE